MGVLLRAEEAGSASCTKSPFIEKEERPIPVRRTRAEKRSRRPITRKLRNAVIEFYSAGLGVTEITRKTGLPGQSVRRILAAETGRKSTPALPINEQAAGLIEKLVREGKSFSQIAAELDRAKITPPRAKEWRSVFVSRYAVRNGLVLGRDPTQVAERFAQFVDKRGEHRVWIGGRHPDGHGLFSFNGKTTTAQRFAWEQANPPLSPEQRLLRTCGRAYCIRPEHWRIQGTFAEEFSRRTKPQGTCLIWLGRRSAKGYGLVAIPGAGSSPAHRAAWKLANGDELDSKTHLHHICRNPSCVNVGHLLPVSAAGKSSHKNLHLLEDELSRLLAAGGAGAEAAA